MVGVPQFPLKKDEKTVDSKLFYLHARNARKLRVVKDYKEKLPNIFCEIALFLYEICRGLVVSIAKQIDKVPRSTKHGPLTPFQFPLQHLLVRGTYAL